MAEWKIVDSSLYCSKRFRGLFDGAGFSCELTGKICTEENCKRALSKFEKTEEEKHD